MRIGFIGSGNIGGTVARLAAANGHEVWLANSRGPETLADLAASIGPSAHTATLRQAAEAGELVVVSIPFGRIRAIPAAPLAGKTVVDANNYYPQRDGQWSELDTGGTTSSELLAAHLPGAQVVKMFNTIYYVHLVEHARPTGVAGRRALPIAGDDAVAKRTVVDLVDEMGFDVVDAGPLAEGRRFQPDTPPYGAELDAEQLAELLS